MGSHVLEDGSNLSNHGLSLSAESNELIVGSLDGFAAGNDGFGSLDAIPNILEGGPQVLSFKVTNKLLSVVDSGGNGIDAALDCISDDLHKGTVVETSVDLGGVSQDDGNGRDGSVVAILESLVAFLSATDP